jgi:sugar-specific transcriptional regulator TrmB
MLESDKSNLLMGLGLTINQAKVYQTLIKIGSATVIQIAKSSFVRREDVYKVLPALEKMGLAEKLVGKPALIRATPVAGALASLINDEKVKSDERIASMKMKFQELSEAKWVQPLAPGKDESLFALIPEGKAMVAKFTSLIVACKIDVFWIGNSKEVSHVACLLSSEIKRAIHRGVEVKIIVEDFHSDQNQKKQVQQCINIDAFNIRFHTSPLKKFAAFDGKDAMISTDRGRISEDTSSLWTNDANLIGILKGYFDSAWSLSEERHLTVN